MGLKNMFAAMCTGVSRAVAGVSSGAKKLSVSVFAVLLGASAFAEDAVSQSISFPTGVDVANTITSAIPLLGGVVAVAIAGYTGFLLVRKCFRWIGKALG